MRKLLLALAAFLLPVCVMAQDDDGFTADRPGTTSGVDVLPLGRLQWETGAAWELTDDPTTTTWTLNTTLLRWGFSKSAELRVQGDFLYSSCNDVHTQGISNLAVGTKVRLFEGGEVLPAISMLANVYLPGVKQSTFLPAHWGGQIALLFQNQLTSWLSLGYEGDLIWSDDGRPTVFYGICFGFDINDRFSMGIEEYNLNTSNGTECWSEISVAWMLLPYLQLDLGTDISLSNPGKYHNFMLGLAWQITK